MNLNDPIMKTKWAKCIKNDNHKVSLTVADCYIVEASKKNDPVHRIRIIDIQEKSIYSLKNILKSIGNKLT
ncbi:MAG: hypothetical protein KBF99_00575 [Leptospiraceae bacterium]|nr:hypothetical protein [Leptospiraceae bacterium]MBK7058560.1 hypothetical protein [Leptospiraceae bacterium]MBK9503367.1 hypothetical protein [Leptospiraceae bacterium]MBP9161636.1 hypothetical protein [Leptospiraceae bacterium]